MLTLELLRLDELTAAVWPAAQQDNLRAVDTLLRIMGRRSKYLGLDASESRGAGAARHQADAAEVDAAAVFHLMMSAVLQLGLTDEQQQAVPGLILRQLELLS